MSTVHALGSSESALSAVYDGALTDLDGVAYRGPDAIPSAPPAIAQARAAGMKFIFVTNNASREPNTVSEHLSSLDIPCSDAEVLTAAQALAVLMSEELPTGSTVLPVGGPGLITALTQAGFTLVASADDNPVAVAQGFNPDVSWKNLAEAAYAIARGARYFASNLDLSIPNDRGIAPGNGSLVAAVTNATGVVPTSAGKPEPTMFRLAVAQIAAQRPLAIGDRLDTDIQGANSAGVPSLMVLTGVNTVFDVIAAPAHQRPLFIGEDLSALHQVHQAPSLKDGRWTFAGNTAEVSRDGVLNYQGDVSLDGARAIIAAAWAHIDGGKEIDVPSFRQNAVVSHYG